MLRRASRLIGRQVRSQLLGSDAVLLRAQQGSYGGDGRWIQPDRIEVPVRVVAAPTPPGVARDILPEGADLSAMREFWMEDDTADTPTETTSGDWIQWSGFIYRVVSVAHWTGFIAVSAVYMDPQP